MPALRSALVVHGGGPSVTLNASLVGVIERWTELFPGAALHGARYGPEGLLLPAQRAEAVHRVEATWASTERCGRCVIAVCEGLRDLRGEPFGADLARAGDRQHEPARNLADTPARQNASETGLRARAERLAL